MLTRIPTAATMLTSPEIRSRMSALPARIVLKNWLISKAGLTATATLPALTPYCSVCAKNGARAFTRIADTSHLSFGNFGMFSRLVIKRVFVRQGGGAVGVEAEHLRERTDDPPMLVGIADGDRDRVFYQPPVARELLVLRVGDVSGTGLDEINGVQHQL